MFVSHHVPALGRGRLKSVWKPFLKTLIFKASNILDSSCPHTIAVLITVLFTVRSHCDHHCTRLYSPLCHHVLEHVAVRQEYDAAIAPIDDDVQSEHGTPRYSLYSLAVLVIVHCTHHYTLRFIGGHIHTTHAPHRHTTHTTTTHTHTHTHTTPHTHSQRPSAGHSLPIHCLSTAYPLLICCLLSIRHAMPIPVFIEDTPIPNSEVRRRWIGGLQDPRDR
jgi:hypothetical protein